VDEELTSPDLVDYAFRYKVADVRVISVGDRDWSKLSSDRTVCLLVQTDSPMEIALFWDMTPCSLVKKMINL